MTWKFIDQPLETLVVRRAKNCIQQIFNKLSSCPIKEIEKVCNGGREKSINEWKTQNPCALIKNIPGVNCSYWQGIGELCPEFELYDPKDKYGMDIEIDIKEKEEDVHHPGVPMMCITSGDSDLTRSTIDIFLKNFKDLNNFITNNGLTMKQAVFHEFLHACGDRETHLFHAKNQTPRADGIIRVNFIGVESIKRILENQQ